MGTMTVCAASTGALGDSHVQDGTGSSVGLSPRARLPSSSRHGPLDGARRFDASIEIPALRALLRISDAVMRAQYFDEVLEVIAEQARLALSSASVAICRWEPDRGALRTLVNVGDLAPHEHRWPRDDFYPVATSSNINALLRHGVSYAFSLEDDDCPPESRQVLTELGKDSELAVPVMVGDSMWGVIWATGTGGQKFDSGNMQLLQAIAAHTAVAIGRSELLTTVWRYAFEDPLTGIANRRALDQRISEIDWETMYPVVILCDLDGFKKINDRNGHPAGDQLLRDVARELDRLTGAIEGAVAGRLGGDEFCVLLPDATLGAAQVFAIDATKAIRDSVDIEVTLSWGAAAGSLDVRNGYDLMAAADAALMESKRQGPARFSTGVSTSVVTGGIDRRDIGERQGGELREVEQLVAIVVRTLDEQPDLTVPEALEILAMQAQQVIGTAGWSISECTENCTMVRAIRSVDSVLRSECGLSVTTELGPDSYDLADFPVTGKALTEGSTFVAAAGLDGSDPAEVALLSKLGYRAVLGVGVPAGRRCFLLEFFSHGGYQELIDIAPLVRVLASYCGSRLGGTRSPHRQS
jgi:diguanylate cyclase (GGDEF)-like protein